MLRVILPADKFVLNNQGEMDLNFLVRQIRTEPKGGNDLKNYSLEVITACNVNNRGKRT